MAIFRRDSDAAVAKSKYPGRESATARATRKAPSSMGKGHRSANAADQAGWSWHDKKTRTITRWWRS